MSASRKLLLAALAVALVQIAALSWMIVQRAQVLREGREVVLEVEPVDPRDLLRGEYVRLRYNISDVPVELIDKTGADAEGADDQTVFVRLRAGDDGIWQPVAASYGQRPAPAAAAGEVDIRGTADYWPGAGARSVPVTYGVERFYLPEGQARPIEDRIRERTFRMKLAVAQDGSAQIKAFYDGDQLIYAEPLY